MEKAQIGRPREFDAEEALQKAMVVFWEQGYEGASLTANLPARAESAKLLENVFRSVNIALVNELKTIFARMGIDIWEVIRAAETKPFGFMPFVMDQR